MSLPIQPAFVASSRNKALFDFIWSEDKLSVAIDVKWDNPPTSDDIRECDDFICATFPFEVGEHDSILEEDPEKRTRAIEDFLKGEEP